MNEKPGISSSVIAAPPTRSFFSSTSVRSPALPRYAAWVRPLWPPPTTIASKSWELMPSSLFLFRGGSKNGIEVVVTRTVVLWWATASSSRRSVPAAARSGRTRAMPMWRCSIGE